MTLLRRHHRYTYADDVAPELDATPRHAFLDGEIYALTHGSEDYSALSAQVLRPATSPLPPRQCPGAQGSQRGRPGRRCGEVITPELLFTSQYEP